MKFGERNFGSEHSLPFLSFPFLQSRTAKATEAASSQLQGGRVGVLLCRAGVPSVPSCRSPPPQPPRAAEQVVGRPRAGALKAAPCVNARVKGTIFSAVRYRALLLLLKRERKTASPRKEQNKGEEISRGPRSERLSRLSRSAETGRRTWAIFLSA